MLGKALRDARIALGPSQADVTDMVASVSSTQLSSFENRHALPTLIGSTQSIATTRSACGTAEIGRGSSWSSKASTDVPANNLAACALTSFCGSTPAVVAFQRGTRTVEPGRRRAALACPVRTHEEHRLVAVVHDHPALSGAVVTSPTRQSRSASQQVVTPLRHSEGICFGQH